MEKATFGAGCFWGVEAAFLQVPGVVETAVGFMGGRTPNPSYKQVCYEDTGHAEVVHLTYDPAKVKYDQLLEVFWSSHDPTQLNRQGPDVGDQYRSGIWTTNETQQREAEKFIAEQTEKKAFGGRKIVTQVEPAKTFFPAEDYHQDYIAKTGRACHVKNPW